MNITGGTSSNAFSLQQPLNDMLTLTTLSRLSSASVPLLLFGLGGLASTASAGDFQLGSGGYQALSPAGYTAAINTPTADALGWGAAHLALTHHNPEERRYFREGSFGSLNFGVGFLPGLEAVGRLSFDGDLDCNMYRPGCSSRSRDLSVSAKYQIPWRPWAATRLAVGVTDFGGAATNYRQAYGVATTSWHNTEWSLGYSRAQSPRALMDGPFGSVRLALSSRWHLLAEHDTQGGRAGLQYQRPIADRMALMATYSRLWKGPADREPSQLQLALVFHLDSIQPRPVVDHEPSTGGVPMVPVKIARGESPVMASVPQPVTPPVQLQVTAPVQTPAQVLAQRLQDLGFAHIGVHHHAAQADQPGLWKVTAEPRAWRQSQIEGLGQALRPWLGLLREQAMNPEDRIHLTLTYQREPVLHAYAQAHCLNLWVQGQPCSSGEGLPLTLSRTALDAPTFAPGAPSAVDSAVASADFAWAPQLTWGAALRNTVGTEYGLVDYSLAAELGVEMGLVRGLFWQAAYRLPVSHSDDFGAGGVFADRRFARSQWHSSLLSYWKPLPFGVSAQVAVGQRSPGQRGAQVDAVWMSPDGRWRLGATGARYTLESSTRLLRPVLASVRDSLLPGSWHAEMTGGQFLNNDRGLRLASVHWFGDTRLSIHYHKSGYSRPDRLPDRSFMGFSVSFPLGPKSASAVGPVWVRGQDRWAWGLQTKVGESDNIITQGYAELPYLRHGLWTDVSDHDRNGQADLQAQWPRLRALLGS